MLLANLNSQHDSGSKRLFLLNTSAIHEPMLNASSRLNPILSATTVAQAVMTGARFTTAAFEQVPSTPTRKSPAQSAEMLGMITVSPPNALLRSPEVKGLTKVYLKNDFRDLRQASAARQNTSRMPSRHVDVSAWPIRTQIRIVDSNLIGFRTRSFRSSYFTIPVHVYAASASSCSCARPELAYETFYNVLPSLTLVCCYDHINL